ncbi:hypothetical protein HMPREF2852_06400 [Anaerococcus sp. HMSC065G05]|uniref:hypothetical protein n=1 Tax=Anaerococcus sp. HMSC065G05 TaxID=1739356 RepID=UPI0008A64355|nr:hypothetical protein [Anaerococcus sp. HMSC065G05]OFJ69657.1 hypothetical protein HMPREF2852_06400 [Anaerococcus sp. HMSC065G05]
MTELIKINDIITIDELGDLLLKEYKFNLFEQDWENLLFNDKNVAIDIDDYTFILYSFEIVEKAEEKIETLIKITNIEEI